MNSPCLRKLGKNENFAIYLRKKSDYFPVKSEEISQRSNKHF